MKEKAEKNPIYNFKLPLSTVRNIIRKWKINGTVEVKTRSGSLRKFSDTRSQAILRNAQKNPHITAKKEQQPQVYLNKKCASKYAKENIEKSEAFWNNVLWTEQTKMELGLHRSWEGFWSTPLCRSSPNP